MEKKLLNETKRTENIKSNKQFMKLNVELLSNSTGFYSGTNICIIHERSFNFLIIFPLTY